MRNLHFRFDRYYIEYTYELYNLNKCWHPNTIMTPPPQFLKHAALSAIWFKNSNAIMQSRPRYIIWISGYVIGFQWLSALPDFFVWIMSYFDMIPKYYLFGNLFFLSSLSELTWWKDLKSSLKLIICALFEFRLVLQSSLFF